MENENLKWRYRGWCPSNDYEVHEVTVPALRKRFDRDPLHQKGRVAFKSIVEEAIPVTEEATPLPDEANHGSGFRSVDQNADAFIKQERRRIELARLKSLGQI